MFKKSFAVHTLYSIFSSLNLRTILHVRFLINFSEKNIQEKLEQWFYCTDDSIYVSFYASSFIHIGCIGNRIRHQTLEREQENRSKRLIFVFLLIHLHQGNSQAMGLLKSYILVFFRFLLHLKYLFFSFDHVIRRIVE